MPTSHDDPTPGPELGATSATAVHRNGHGEADASVGGPGRSWRGGNEASRAAATSGGPGTTRRARGPGPSVWPATIVLGVALVVLAVGGALALVGRGPVSTGPVTPKVRQAPGTPAVAVAADNALAPVITPGRPPADVVDAVVLPTGAAVTPGSAVNRGVGLYDWSIGFSTRLTQEVVIDFYRAELPAEGWRVISQGPPHDAPGFEVLGRMSGSDGYSWEIGVTVSPTEFPTGSASTPTGMTPFTLRLFAVDDAT